MSYAGIKTSRTVVFLDVLGFKEKVETMPLEKLAQEYENFIAQIDVLNRPLDIAKKSPTLFPSHPTNAPFCLRYIFSDTIILIALDESEASCLKLLVYAWRLTQLCIGRGVFLRGAVVFDEIYLNLDRHILLGKALTRAYELEKQQQWIGVAIDTSVEESYPRLFREVKEIHFLSSPFFRYDVPFKGGNIRNLHTLNWRWNLIVENGTRSLFLDSSTPDIKEKVNNSLSYAKAVVDSGRIYISNQEYLPLELRSLWIGQSTPPFEHGDDL